MSLTATRPPNSYASCLLLERYSSFTASFGRSGLGTSGSKPFDYALTIA